MGGAVPGPQIGIDLGGTKIAIIALSHSGETLLEERRPTPAGNYKATLDLIAEMVGDAENHLHTTASVGVATPGSLSPATGLLRNSNSTWMNGKPLSQDLQERMGRKVRFENDANCFALSEAVDGAGAGCNGVFGVIIGTGCGGGIVENGKIISGANRIGGEWGHNPLPWPDDSEYPAPECWCGRRGCQEVWLSGSGLARDHEKNTGEAIMGEEIVSRAQNGDAGAKASLERHTRRLAKGLACVVNIIDPDVIVLGGGLSKLEHLYEQLPDLMRPYVFSDSFVTKILPPKHGDASGVRGAAWLWNDQG